MDRELFGTDGVRGIAGEYPLDGTGTHRIGMAVGTHFAEPGQQIVIASDPRQSSPQIVADLMNGLNAVGVDVVSAGVIPTPGLAYLTREHDQFAAGVMVTASHNPAEYNGIKVFDNNGNKLSDETEAILNDLIRNGVPERGRGRASENPGLIKDYEDFLVASVQGLQLGNLKIAVDSANGAASGLAGRVFKRLGADVTALFYQPDGMNINDGCGATDTNALAREVKEQGLDLGIALDGDADRLIMIDGQGRQVMGDHIIYLLATQNQLDGVVVTAMSNMGFEQALQRKHIKVERTAVGDRYVLEGLKGTGYKLGGEQSGHIIFPDLLLTGDALLAAVQVLSALADSAKTLAEWRDEVILLPQSIVNIVLDNKTKLNRPNVQSYLRKKTQEFAGRGRLIIRPSGTEPLLRVMVESADADKDAQNIVKELELILEEKA